jgi:FkbM family methyltransferase
MTHINTIKSWFHALPLRLFVPLLGVQFIKKVFGFNELGTYFSQTGEDIIIASILDKKNGFYVEVGCNEPIRLSNTFSLYLNNWRGILIDANEDLIKKCKKIRPKDTAITAAISDVEKDVEFHIANASAVSTIDEKTYEDWKSNWDYAETKKMRTQTLNRIFDQYLPKGQTIDVLSIDVEGHDYNALISFDMAKYRPRLIVVEIHGLNINQMKDDKIVNYLTANNYELVGYIIMNAYFKDKTV